ncbi:SDR family oxidoreductase [Belliella kenyensis]|uniref:SDR family oxidoreductase n=1 Tax=Belliella kenyensis TaxID=1472724 RepID=A0ABV8EIE7_9BACT|nr:SDR family oxidoreductase [Belliella kenyensis]MCH7403113.1 SDR family oxidoreductase [Belliella kenyensis]MDN3602282.1 SDR family oxidoreductase [Belliella kenyensis]
MSMHILVTGGTKGIGRAIVERFAKEGFDVSTCARSEEDLKDLETFFSSNYPNQQLLAFRADLSKREDVLKFSNEVKERLGTPDVLVNNTGVFLPGAIHTEEEGNLEKMIETNLYSAYYLTRSFVPEMIARAYGHIFSMGSIAGLTAYPNGGSYAISKWAMLGFTKCLRQELSPFHIKVTSILPGATYTASWEGVDVAEERLMKASDVAESVWGAFRLSPGAVVEEIVIRPQLGDL